MLRNIEIDARLLRRAMRLSGAQTEQEAVEAGLRLLNQTHLQAGMRKFRGKVEWDGNLEISRGATPAPFQSPQPNLRTRTARRDAGR